MYLSPDKAVIDFARSILHGSPAHRAWLSDAAAAYILDKEVFAPPVEEKPDIKAVVNWVKKELEDAKEEEKHFGGPNAEGGFWTGRRNAFASIYYGFLAKAFPEEYHSTET